MTEEPENKTFATQAASKTEDEEVEYYYSYTQKGIRKYKEIQKESTKKFLVWVTAGIVTGFVTSGYVGMFLKSRVKNQLKMRNYKLITFLSIFAGISYHGSKLARRDLHKEVKQIQMNPEYCFKVDHETAKQMMQNSGNLK